MKRKQEKFKELFQLKYVKFYRISSNHWRRELRMKNIVIHVEHLYKTYPSLTAVHDLSFSVHSATCFGFLGPNGAGKTTALTMLYGMCDRDPHPETRVEVFGYDPQKNELEIKFLSGVVPQEDNLDEELNVVQNLQVYSNFYGMKKKKQKNRIAYLLEFFELSEKKKAKIRELSGGMKRRLLIARALLHMPKLLILDEPTTGLDPQVRHLIWNKLRELKQQGLTILLTTHYMEEAFQLCDTILIMDKGRKVLEGNPQQLLEAHLEPWALEVHEIDLSAIKIPEGVRKDGTLSHSVLYAHDLSLLQKLNRELPPGTGFLRPSNLEDLFFKMTGRLLNEKQ